MEEAVVIAVSTNKGGVLKTSISTNLAGVLAEQGNMVLIIDADNQGNALLSFGKNPDTLSDTLYEVLTKDLDVYKAIVNVHPNIDILPSDDGMARFEFEVLTNIDKYENGVFNIFNDKLSVLKQFYDYIIIDTPPNLGLMQGNVLAYSDKVIIPFQPEVYSMRALSKIIETINDFKDTLNNKLDIIGVIATLVDSRTGLHSDVIQECRKYCFENDIRMFDTVIPRSIRFASSVAYDKLPAVLTVKNNELVDSYKDFYKELKEVF